MLGPRKRPTCHHSGTRSCRAPAARQPCRGARHARAGHAADTELQRGHPAARAQNACELEHRRGGIIDVAQQIGEVSRRRHRRRTAACSACTLQQLIGRVGVAAKRSRARASICGALVDSDDRAARRPEAAPPRPSPSRGDVEDTIARRAGAVAPPVPAPARVLPEAERRRERVIAARQAAKQLNRLELAGGRRAVGVVGCVGAHHGAI